MGDRDADMYQVERLKGGEVSGCYGAGQLLHPFISDAVVPLQAWEPRTQSATRRQPGKPRGRGGAEGSRTEA